MKETDVKGNDILQKVKPYRVRKHGCQNLGLKERDLLQGGRRELYEMMKMEILIVVMVM